MNTRFKKGDIVVSKGFTLNKKFSPFRVVNAVVKKTSLIHVDNNRFPTQENDYRKVKDIDYITDAIIKDSIKLLHSTDDPNQHISSVSGEPKQGYNSDTKAYVSAYKMCYNYGGEWVIYKCNVCDKFHIGKELE